MAAIDSAYLTIWQQGGNSMQAIPLVPQPRMAISLRYPPKAKYWMYYPPVLLLHRPQNHAQIPSTKYWNYHPQVLLLHD